MRSGEYPKCLIDEFKSLTRRSHAGESTSANDAFHWLTWKRWKQRGNIRCYRLVPCDRSIRVLPAWRISFNRAPFFQLSQRDEIGFMRWLTQFGMRFYIWLMVNRERIFFLQAITGWHSIVDGPGSTSGSAAGHLACPDDAVGLTSYLCPMEEGKTGARALY